MKHSEIIVGHTYRCTPPAPRTPGDVRVVEKPAHPHSRVKVDVDGQGECLWVHASMLEPLETERPSAAPGPVIPADVLAKLPSATIADLCAALVDVPHQLRRVGEGKLAGEMYRAWSAVRDERDRRMVLGAECVLGWEHDPRMAPRWYILDTHPALDVVKVCPRWPHVEGAPYKTVSWSCVRLV